MKKLFTLVFAAMTAMAVNAETVETNLELTGSNLTLPAIYLTGEASFENYKKWGEVRFFDKEQSSGLDPYEIYAEEYPTLHLEFEALSENLQLHIKCGDVEKYLELNPEQLTLDVPFDTWDWDLSAPITHIGLQAKENDMFAQIKKCVLLDEEGEDGMTLYYVNNNKDGWGVKVNGKAKLLDGKVTFMKKWAQLGGTAWAPADILGAATSAEYIVKLNDPVPSGFFQVVVDAQKTLYYTLEAGATEWSVATAEAGYVPSEPSVIQNVRIQYTEAPTEGEEESLNIKSVVLRTESGASGIYNTTYTNISEQATYNLAGQKVGADVKGIIVKGGKKIFVK